VGACAGSDKPQKLLRFNSAQKLPFVRMRLESIQLPKPFQAEYSASLPNCWPSPSSSLHLEPETPRRLIRRRLAAALR
jgi:hypothetical protein